MATGDASVVAVLDQTHDFSRSSRKGTHGWTTKSTPTAALKRRRHGWSVEDVACDRSPSMEYARNARGAPHRSGSLSLDYDPFCPSAAEGQLAENRSTRPDLQDEYGNKVRGNEKFDSRIPSGEGRRSEDLRIGSNRTQLQRLGPPGDGPRGVSSSPVEQVTSDVKIAPRISIHSGRPDHISQGSHSKNVSPLAAPANLAPCKEAVGAERDVNDAGAAGDNHEDGWFYHNAYSYLSGPFTLEVLREGFNVSFLPGDLVVYHRQDGAYSAPQKLKMLIGAPTASLQLLHSRPREYMPEQVKVFCKFSVVFFEIRALLEEF